MTLQESVPILVGQKPEEWQLELNATYRGFIEIKIVRPDKSIAMQGDMVEHTLVNFVEVLKAMKNAR